MAAVAVAEGGGPLQRLVAIVRAQARPIKFLASRVLMAIGVHRYLPAIRQDGFRIRFDRANLAAALWIDPGHETDWTHGGWEDYFLRAYLQRGDRVVDVGANIGFTAILAASITEAPVFAFEAHPETVRLLEGNVAENDLHDLVTCYSVAVGAQKGHVAFSSERADDRRAVIHNGSESLAVPIARLDDFDFGIEPISLLKVDVEGYELFVFQGASKTLTRTQCVYFESLDEHYERFGYDGEDVRALLRDAGFALFKPRRSGILWPVKPGHKAPIYENLIAVRDPEDLVHRTGWQIQEPPNATLESSPSV